MAKSVYSLQFSSGSILDKKPHSGYNLEVKDK